MSQIADGDKEALKSFVSAFWKSIKAAAYRVLKDDGMCDDVLNAVILKIWTGADKIKNLKNPCGYICTMAYNSAIDIKRKEKEVFFDDERLNTISTPPLNDEKLLIESTLEKIEPEMRSVLILKASCGYTFYEIAKIKNIPYKKARRLYIAACDLFKKLYEET